MDNFEKRVFLDYFYKLSPEMNISDYPFDNVFDSMIEEFKIPKKFFKFDKYGNLRLDKSEERKTFLSDIRKIVYELKQNFKSHNTNLENKLNILRDIFSLDKSEYEVFQFFMLQEHNGIFRQMFNCIDGNPPQFFCSKYLGLRSRRCSKILENLASKNIINRKRDDSLNPLFIEILENPACKSRDKITGILLGKKLKSALTKIDFEHFSKERLVIQKILTSAVAQQTKGINILLYGDVGTGKTEFAKLVANCAKIPVYEVTTEIKTNEEADRSDRLFDLYSKLHILASTHNACILFDEAEDVMNRGISSKGYFNNLLERTSVPVIWTTNNIFEVDPAFLRRMTYCVEFSKLSEETRLNIWKKVLNKNHFEVDEEKIKELNKSYEISPSIISNAVRTTKMINGNSGDFEQFIVTVAKVVSKKQYVKKDKEFEFAEYDENLVNTDLDIKNLTSKIKACGNLNFSLCLYGEPGTGKSLYGKYLAKELGIEVIYKKASDLLSCFIGETEKNISNAFAEAKSKKAMLIFDEADTFLQNRNNAVRSWEISEVNEMLTRMESHEYPFICTTNLLNTLDEASLRRFTFKIKFDFMTKEQANKAFEHFFGIKDYDLNLRGLTPGDFATVKKKADFLKIKDKEELKSMLEQEVKLKSSKELKRSVGF